jgi:RNA polymerase sigma-70 factor (ECF subfamily)
MTLNTMPAGGSDESPSRDWGVRTSERSLVEALRRGDDAAFMFLVTAYHAALVRLARMYVVDDATAEEVAQETWLAVLRGIDRFEERSSLKTWIFRILVNRAKTRGVRDGRTVPFSSLETSGDDDAPAVDADRFASDDSPWPGHWIYPPVDWQRTPEELALNAETRRVITDAIDALPPAQRAVITLRDVEGLSGDEVREALGVSEANVRVLLHRARARVRAALERYFERETRR